MSSLQRTNVTDSVGEVSKGTFLYKTVTWKIPNFLDLPSSVDYYVHSPEFSFADGTWCLRLFTNGEKKSDSEGYINLYVLRLSTCVPEQRLGFRVGFKTRHGENYKCYTNEFTLGLGFKGCGVDCYLKRSEVVAERELLVPDGTVTFVCQVRVRKEVTSEASFRHQQDRREASHSKLPEGFTFRYVQVDVEYIPEEYYRHQQHWDELPPLTELPEASSQLPKSVIEGKVEEASGSVHRLQSDYRHLLESGEDSDVSLKVSDKEFRAHKCILKARSKVFSDMFRHETEEKYSKEVVIDDLDPDSFSEFLQHMYAGRLETLSDEKAFRLYVAADKFDMSELKSECLDYMKRTLSVETFCDAMTLALKHKEEELLTLATDFFAKNLEDIIVTVEWKMFSKYHNTEASQLFFNFLRKEMNKLW